MRTAVSMVLVATLFTTPLKLVLAQADQQKAATVQQTVALDSARQNVIRVPQITPETARLWEPGAGKAARADIFTHLDGMAPATQGTPVVTKIGIVLVVVAAVALILIVVLCSGGGLGEGC